MSKLYYTESGRVVPTLCEELTTYRRVRKLLTLPPTAADGTLYLLARCSAQGPWPLRLSLNRRELPAIPASPASPFRWYEVLLPKQQLVAGDNVFEFWTDSTAMNAWSLAIEDGHAAPRSQVSDDSGRTWRDSRMGYLNVLRGEYVARVRLAEGQDPPAPEIAWEDSENERLAHLRELLPAAALRSGPLMTRVRGLASWLSASWEHTNSVRGVVYGPWDAETILAWGKAQIGHEGRRPIVMCVHYAVALVSCCAAAAIPARCAVLLGSVNGGNGHFVAEVWFDEYRKWVMVDPNADAIFYQDGIPLSLPEIQAAGSDVSRLIAWGPGSDYQRGFPHIVQFLNENYLKGICFRHRSTWARTDFLSHPELTPPGHGSLSYCETDLIWEQRDLEAGFGMFPSFGGPEYFDSPPGALA
jgi:hypothetical protein